MEWNAVTLAHSSLERWSLPFQGTVWSTYNILYVDRTVPWNAPVYGTVKYSFMSHITQQNGHMKWKTKVWKWNIKVRNERRKYEIKGTSMKWKLYYHTRPIVSRGWGLCLWIALGRFKFYNEYSQPIHALCDVTIHIQTAWRHNAAACSHNGKHSNSIIRHTVTKTRLFKWHVSLNGFAGRAIQ